MISAKPHVRLLGHRRIKGPFVVGRTEILVKAGITELLADLIRLLMFSFEMKDVHNPFRHTLKEGFIFRVRGRVEICTDTASIVVNDVLW